jgi:hypothetical protein
MSGGLWEKLKQRLQKEGPARPETPKIVIPEVVIQRTRLGQTAVSQLPTSTIDPIFLRQQMSNHLDDAQLLSLSEKIGLPYEALPGGKGRKVLELVTAFEKEGKLEALLQLCQMQNGKIEWQMENKDE